ncbi:MAG: Type 1 glutamine amidotransferase-like domain-containing protein, partial [Bdellovibrionales bacterium]|nr:Type 1 glutamine amidotransferase-like domain-containing protein [Bdellovibrionales bacterium]
MRLMTGAHFTTPSYRAQPKCAPTRIGVLGAAVSCAVLFWAGHASALQVYRTGSPHDAATATSSLTCLAGGGSDDLWAAGWRRMLELSGGGDVVVVRADGERGDYESWIYADEGGHRFPRVNSVTTVVLDARRDADDPRAVEAVGNAEMIFFAGGDQSRYVDWIHRTGFERALYAAIFQRSVPVGGTSAGMAFLAGIDYTGRFSSPSSPGGWVSSEDVLADPSGAFVDLNPLVLVGPL